MTTEQLLEIAKSKPYSIDDTLVIDAKNKKIINTSSKELILGVETDKETKRIHFLCPRIVGNGKDVSEFQIRVNFLNANKKTDFDVCTDTVFYKDYVEFSWEVSPKATKYKGMTNFIICMIKTQSDGSIKNEWNTTLAEGKVLEGLEVDIPEEEFEEPKDIVLQLLGMLDEKEAELIEEVENIRTDVKADIESTKQKAMDDVEAKGVETLAKIPEDYTYIANLAEENKQLKANAIKRTYSGETIVARDSSGVHLEGLRVLGRSEQVSTTGAQLFDASKLATKTQDGATVTNNGDGSFTVSGSGTLTVDFNRNYTYSHEDSIKLIKEGMVYISQSDVNPHIEMNFITSKGTSLISSRGVPSTKITSEMLEDLVVRIYVFSGNGNEIVSGTVKPMVWQDGDGTWEPFTGGYASPSPNWQQPVESVGDDGSVDVGVYGKNLLPFPYYGSSNTTNGGTMTIQEDGSIACSGTPTDYCAIMMYNGGPIITDKFMLCCFGDCKNVTLQCSIHDGNGNLLGAEYVAYSGSKYVDVTKYPTAEKMTIAVKRSENNIAMSGTMYPMIVAGDVVPTVYEKYKDVQNLQISTPNGLPGIPLGTTIPDAITSSEKHMSGVYWDDKTQQYYIGDEKDYGREKYVQRVESFTFNGTETGNWESNSYYVDTFFYTVRIRNLINSPALCDKYVYDEYVTKDGTFMFGTYINIRNSKYTTGEELRADLQNNPITVKFVLAEPIETDISTSEIEAYKALTSNYPTTTILNDENAHMEAVLVTDTKNHIEQNYVPKEAFLSVVDRVSALEQKALA